MYKACMLHRQLPSFLANFLPILYNFTSQTEDDEHKENRRYFHQTPSLSMIIGITSWQRHIGHTKYVKSF